MLKKYRKRRNEGIEQEKQEQDKSILRPMKAYTLSMILCLCLCALSCGVCIAQNNTRALGLGEEQARVVLSQKEDRLVLQAPQKEVHITPVVGKAMDGLLRFSPPPVSALYWMAQCVKELVA